MVISPFAPGCPSAKNKLRRSRLFSQGRQKAFPRPERARKHFPVWHYFTAKRTLLQRFLFAFSPKFSRRFAAFHKKRKTRPNRPFPRAKGIDTGAPFQHNRVPFRANFSCRIGGCTLICPHPPPARGILCRPAQRSIRPPRTNRRSGPLQHSVRPTAGRFPRSNRQEAFP